MSIPQRQPSGRYLALAVLVALVLAASAASVTAYAHSNPPDHGATVAPATAITGSQASTPQIHDDDRKSSKIIRGHLVRPLGWVAALFMVSASLYYSAKRSVLIAVQAAEGPQRRLVGSELRQALDRHIVASLIAIGIAVLHVLNFFGSIRLTLGWLTLVLMLAVALSGIFGRFFTGAPGVRRNWRRFHLPLTYAFFALLAVHVIQAIEIFED